VTLRAVFGLLGVGVLVPWNAFISAKGYYYARLCRIPTLGSSVESVFAIVYNLSAVVSMGLIILVQWIRDSHLRNTEQQEQDPSRSPADTVRLAAAAEALDAQEEDATGSGLDTPANNGNSICSGTRQPDTSCERSATAIGNTGGHSYIMVMVPTALTLLVFLGQSVLVVVLNMRPRVFEALMLLSLVLSGICVSIASAGVVATAGLFEADTAINPFMAGQSLGGVLVSFAGFVAASWEDPSAFWQSHCKSNSNSTVVTTTALWVAEDDPSSCTTYDKVDAASLVYFLMGSLTLTACLFGYSFVDGVQKTINEYEKVGDGDAIFRGSANNEQLQEEEQDAAVNQSPRIGLELHTTTSEGSLGVSRRSHEAAADGAATVAEEIYHHSPSSAENETSEILSRVKGAATAIFLAFFVTLSLFPGWTSELKSVRQCQSESRLSNDLYIPFTFVLFNVGDLAGRLLAAKLPLGSRASEKLVAAAVLRFLFFPLLFLCVGGGESTESGALRSGGQIKSDLYSVVVQFLFALSNGCLVSASFAHAPTLLHSTAHEQERMSEILTFSLVFGLLSGSLFSWPVTEFASRSQ